MLDKLIQQIADRQSIQEVIYRYCRAMDRRDAGLALSVWHPDGEADFGAFFKGSGQSFVEKICAGPTHILAQSHQISNILITLDADRASSESYLTAALRFRQDGVLMQMTSRGRYADQWSRQGGNWAITKRLYIHDFDDVREVAGSIDSDGKQDRHDPSYGLVPGLD